MRSLLIQVLCTLESRLLQWNDQDIEYDIDRFIEIIHEFDNYCAPVIPLMPLLAEHGCFKRKMKLSVLFLPTFIRSRKLSICLQHGFIAIKILTAQSDPFDSGLLEKVSELKLSDKCSICRRLPGVNRDERLALSVGNFFSLFPRLTVLKFRGYVFPEISLEDVVSNFPGLQELDFFRDWLTHGCVEQLRRLRQLNHLHFYSMHICDNLLTRRRFLLEDATSPIDVNDILLTKRETKILKSILNNLTRSVALSCSRVAMADAAQVIQLCQVRSLALKIVYIMFWDGINYNFAESKEQFPNVNVLRLCDSALGHDTDDKLCKFTNVRHLAISESSNSPSLGVIGCRLRHLEVWMLHLQSRDFVVMSDQCPNVTYLHIGAFDYTETPLVEDVCVPSVSLPFPNLHTLIFYCNDLSGLKHFMSNQSKLVRLFAFDYFSPNGTNSDNPSVIETLIRRPGVWPELEIFHVSNITYKRLHFFSLVRTLPSLRYVLMEVPDRDNGRSFVSARGRTVRLFKCPELHILPSESEFYTWDDRWFQGPTF